jgi:hypothetical protein
MCVCFCFCRLIGTVKMVSDLPVVFDYRHSGLDTFIDMASACAPCLKLKSEQLFVDFNAAHSRTDFVLGY